VDIDLADITLHIDQELDQAGQEKLENALRQRSGVISVRFNPERPHLAVIEYDPKQVSSRDLVDIPKFQGLSAELIGL
jgi:cell division protein FtsX